MTKNEVKASPEVSEPALLSISEVAARSGLTVATLRTWEARYGLPRPVRSPAGQRRYRESDCALLADVVRRRDSGLSLPAAVAQAAADNELSSDRSIFAGLRRRHPHLRTHVLGKALLVSLSRALEDECAARAQRPVLIGCFQSGRFYQPSRRRWENLACTAERTVVFADFDRTCHRPGPLVEVPIAQDSSLRREWALVCDAADHPGCVVGWERLDQDNCADSERMFEVVWSVDPQVVRSAARIGTSLAALTVPELPGQLDHRLAGKANPASADLQRASSLIERTLDYLAR